MSEPTFRFRGGSVGVALGGEVPDTFGVRGEYAEVVQRALDEVAGEWLGTAYKTLYTTTRLQYQVLRDVIRLMSRDRYRVLWAKYKLHTAREVGLSPFIDIDRDRNDAWTDRLTIELAQPRGQSEYDWLMVRAYPGDLRPPLPWQRSAQLAYDGSVEYWRTHAYIYNPRVVIPGSMTDWPPVW